MSAYYFIYCLLFIGAGISFINSKDWRLLLQKTFLPALLCLLVLFAALRSAGVDQDYPQYVDWFNSVRYGYTELIDWIKDPGFVLLLYVSSLFSRSYAIACAAASFLIVCLQYWFSKKVGAGRWVLLFLYLLFCRFFIEQDMTQIRAGIAIPLMSIALVFAFQGKKKTSVVIYCCAVCFHISALVALPILILVLFGVRFESRAWIAWLIPIGIVGAILLKPVFDLLGDFGRTSDYLNGTLDIKHLRLLSVYLILHLVVLSLIYWRLWSKVFNVERFVIVCSAFGLFFQLLLSSNSGIALRVSEVLGYFDMALFIIPLSHLRPRGLTLYALFVVAMGLVFFRSALKIIGPYHWLLG